jgi:NitT/TauT family transport system substrate-binding protein
MAEVMKQLGATAPVAMVGYVFDGRWAERHRDLLDRFFTAANTAKKILASSPAEWQRLAPRIGVSDASALEIYRQRYLQGISHRPYAEDEANARALYHVLAEIGGADLVGSAHELDLGTYYSAGQGE